MFLNTGCRGLGSALLPRFPLRREGERPLARADRILNDGLNSPNVGNVTEFVLFSLNLPAFSSTITVTMDFTMMEGCASPRELEVWRRRLNMVLGRVCRAILM